MNLAGLQIVEREYTLRILQFPKKPAVVASRPGKERQSSATVTWLYRQFVEGHLPRYPTSEQFVASSIPFLLRAMSPRAVGIMAAVFARRHANIWHGDRAQHMSACHTQINNLLLAITAELPTPVLAAISTLQPRCRGSATTTAVICLDLADSQGKFFLDCRSLQRRLLLATPATAGRILTRLVRLGVLQQTERGNTPWSAKAAGDKRRANAFKLILSNA